MEKNLEITKRIIDDNYDHDDELYGTLFLTCYGMVSKYGDTYSPLIHKVFTLTTFIIEDKPLRDILLEAEGTPDGLYNGEELDTEDEETPAVSYPGDYIWFDDNGKVLYEKANPIVYCSTYDRNYNEVLNALIHEASHILKGLMNYIKIDDHNFFSIRSGLYVFGGKLLSDGNIQDIDENLVLDELINVFQTTGAMNEIGKLQGTKLDPVVQKEFDKIDLAETDLLIGYNQCIRAFRPFWNNERFRSVVEDNIITGRLDIIRDDFNEVVGKNYFTTLSRYFNLLYYADSEEEIKGLTDWILMTGRVYNLRSKGLLNFKK